MRIKASIVILLVGILFIKVSASHVYAHESADNQIEACSYCDLAIDNQQSELTPADTAPVITAPFPGLADSKITQPQVAVASIQHATYLFTRPPPMAG